MCGGTHYGEVERVVSVERRSSHSVCFALLQAYHCPLGVSMRWRFEHVPFGQLR